MSAGRETKDKQCNRGKYSVQVGLERKDGWVVESGFPRPAINTTAGERKLKGYRTQCMHIHFFILFYLIFCFYNGRN